MFSLLLSSSLVFHSQSSSTLINKTVHSIWPRWCSIFIPAWINNRWNLTCFGYFRCIIVDLIENRMSSEWRRRHRATSVAFFKVFSSVLRVFNPLDIENLSSFGISYISLLFFCSFGSKQYISLLCLVVSVQNKCQLPNSGVKKSHAFTSIDPKLNTRTKISGKTIDDVWKSRRSKSLQTCFHFFESLMNFENDRSETNVSPNLRLCGIFFSFGAVCPISSLTQKRRVHWNFYDHWKWTLSRQ